MSFFLVALIFESNSMVALFIGILVQVYQLWSFVFYWHFCPSLPTVKVFFFIGILVQVYQLTVLFIGIFVQVCQRWKFCFYWHFCPSLPTVKVLVILVTVSFIGHFGYEYQRWKLCDLEFAFEQPLASRSTTLEFAFAGGNLWHPAVKTVHTPEGNGWHGIRNPHIYVHR